MECLFHDTFYRSFWTLTGSPKLLQHPSILAIAEKLKCTAAQAYFKFAQANGVTPLAGSKNENRMHEGIVTETLDLDEDELQNDLQELRKLVFDQM